MQRIEKAKAALKQGEAHIWVVCLIASRTVGNRDGGTQELAQALLKSASQIENYAYAGLGYRMFRKYTTSIVRWKLSPAHFGVLWTTWRRLEFNPMNANIYLYYAVDEMMNSEQLREYIENDNNVQPKPITLNKSWFDKGWAAIEASKLDAEKREEAFSLFRDFSKIMEEFRK